MPSYKENNKEGYIMYKVKKKETFIPSSNGRDRLHVVVWEPQGDVRAILQISHGMIEMIDRYDEFARYLAARGFVVAGNDHLGHGLTAANTDELGYMHAYDASKTMSADLHRVTRALKRTYKGVPFFLMGHSMGSFMARRYMSEYGFDSKYPSSYTKGSSVDGFICMGTGSMPECMLQVGRLVLELEKSRHGERYRSTLMELLAFGTYIKGIPKETIVNGEVRKRTNKDWISRDPERIDAYVDDPLCQFSFTIKGYETLFNTIHYIQQDRNIAMIPKDIPVLFVSGDKDPVGHYGRDVLKLYELYHNKVSHNVACYMYDDCRHEILNELCRDQVFADIEEWLDGRLAQL